MTIRYRADVDGLRAVAILLVVLYHAYPKVVTGGFVGVDVFFVISGYLITSILLNDLRENRFSFLVFYGNRFRRILPALVVVSLATWLLGRSFLLADEFMYLGKHLLAGATFTSNFLLWKEVDYFDKESTAKPLLHLWSLAVEEQFYLVWPLLLVLWRKTGKDSKALAVGLLGASLLLTRFVPVQAAFYWMPCRLWELMAGCLLSRFEQDGARVGAVNSRSVATGSDFRSYLAAALLVASQLLIDTDQAYPNVLALLPTLSACLFISSSPDARLNRLLSSRVFVFVGKVSYPLYLWHWPLLSIGRLVRGYSLSDTQKLLVVTTSLLLAWLTWRCIELPIKDRAFARLRPLPRARWQLASGFSVLAGVALLGVTTERGGLLSAQHKLMVELVGYESYRANWNGDCFLGHADQDHTRVASRCVAPGGSRSVFLWGDSHAASLYPGLLALGDAGPDAIYQVTATACPPIIDFEKDNRPNCKRINDFALDEIRSLQPTTVILCAEWWTDIDKPGYLDKLSATLRAVEAAGVRNVVVPGSLPGFYPPLHKIMERELAGPLAKVPKRVPVGFNTRLIDVERRVSSRVSGEHVTFVPIVEKLCPAEGCLTMVGDNLSTDLITFDSSGHLTDPGSVFVVRSFLAPVLFRN